MNALHAPDVCTRKWLDVDLVCMLLQFKLISNKSVSGGQPLLVPPCSSQEPLRGCSLLLLVATPHPKLVLQSSRNLFFVCLFGCTRP